MESSSFRPRPLKNPVAVIHISRRLRRYRTKNAWNEREKGDVQCRAIFNCYVNHRIDLNGEGENLESNF